MLTEIETEETIGFIVTFLSLVHFNWVVSGPHIYEVYPYIPEPQFLYQSQLDDSKTSHARRNILFLLSQNVLLSSRKSPTTVVTCFAAVMEVLCSRRTDHFRKLEFVCEIG